MSSVDGGEARHYYVYGKPNVHIGLYDEEEFNEIFMTKDEIRDGKKKHCFNLSNEYFENIPDGTWKRCHRF